MTLGNLSQGWLSRNRKAGQGSGKANGATSGQLPCLTGARFVAALLVVLFHFGRVKPLPGFFFSWGQQAVSFFFILSGLVLTYSYYEAIRSRSVGWSGFMNLRMARIVPLHVATWLIATILFLFFFWKPYQGEHPFVTWMAGLLCWQVYWPSADNLFRWNGQAWSISCELSFYLVFPFILWVLARNLKSTRSLVAAMATTWAAQAAAFFGAAGLFAYYFHSRHPLDETSALAQRLRDVVLVFPPLRLGEFVLGMCLGLLILRRGSVLGSARYANLLFFAGCGAAVAVMKFLPWNGFGPIMGATQEYLLFVPALAAIIFALASGKTVVTPLLENRFAILLGDASYALYLLHGFLEPGSYRTWLRGGISVKGDVANPAVYVLCVLGSILLSIAFYLLLERPARKAWRRAAMGGEVRRASKLVAEAGAS